MVEFVQRIILTGFTSRDERIEIWVYILKNTFRHNNLVTKILDTFVHPPFAPEIILYVKIYDMVERFYTEKKNISGAIYR